MSGFNVQTWNLDKNTGKIPKNFQKPIRLFSLYSIHSNNIRFKILRTIRLVEEQQALDSPCSCLHSRRMKKLTPLEPIKPEVLILFIKSFPYKHLQASPLRYISPIQVHISPMQVCFSIMCNYFFSDVYSHRQHAISVLFFTPLMKSILFYNLTWYS